MRIVAVSLLIMLPATAMAQLTIDPTAPPELPPPGSPSIYIPGQPLPQPPPPAPPTVIIMPPGGQQPPAEPEGMYLGGPVVGTEEGVRRYEGELPEVHVVQKGDTLWDVCAYYFGDSWKWPEVWGLNPAITNPHWIYPGDLVRLMAAGPVATPVATPGEPTPERPEPILTVQSPSGVELRQIAFVSNDDLKISSTVTGAIDAKIMLSERDQIYLEYPEGHPPQVDTLYSIYAPTREIKHPETGKVIGHYVLVRGELKILEVKKDKRALAIIRQVNAHGVIERGDRVGTLKTQLKVLEPVAAQKSVEGVIVGIIEGDDLIGASQVVFIDRGRDDGLLPGNRMLAVRRGDALPKKEGQINSVGEGDRRYPDRYVGTLIVVEVGKANSVGLMLRTDLELVIGDHVLMRKPQ